MKKLRSFVIPAKAGIGAKKFYKYLIGARCARFRVPIPACAGMTIKDIARYRACVLSGVQKPTTIKVPIQSAMDTAVVNTVSEK